MDGFINMKNGADLQQFPIEENWCDAQFSVFGTIDTRCVDVLGHRKFMDGACRETQQDYYIRHPRCLASQLEIMCEYSMGSCIFIDSVQSASLVCAPTMIVIIAISIKYRSRALSVRQTKHTKWTVWMVPTKTQPHRASAELWCLSDGVVCTWTVMLRGLCASWSMPHVLRFVLHVS